MRECKGTRAALVLLLALSAPAYGQAQAQERDRRSSQDQGQRGDDARVQPRHDREGRAHGPSQQAERRRNDPDIPTYRGQDSYRRGAPPTAVQRRHEASRGRDEYRHTYRAPRKYRVRPYARPHGWYSHDWSQGERLPAGFWTRSHWIASYWLYDLPIPPRGCMWVRYGNDALLIDRRSGEVIQVIYDIFY